MFSLVCLFFYCTFAPPHIVQFIASLYRPKL